MAGKYLNPEDAAQEAAVKASLNPENPGSDDMLGAVNENHERTMNRLAGKAEAKRAEIAKAKRQHRIVALVRAICSVILCGLLCAAWCNDLAAPIVAAPLMALLAFDAGMIVGRNPRIFTPWCLSR